MVTPAHRFITLLSNPAAGNAQLLDELQKLAEAYPASHIVQGVLAGVLKKQGSFEYSNRLKTAAITSPSRFALFRYLEWSENTVKEKTSLAEEVKHQETVSTEKPIVKTILVPVEEEPAGEIEIQKITAEDAEPENVKEFISQPHIQLLHTQNEEIFPEEPSLLQQIVASNTPLPDDNDMQEFLTETDTTPVSEKHLDAIKNDPLEREIMSDAINRTIQHEVVMDALTHESDPEPEQDDKDEEEKSGFAYWLDPGKLHTSRREEKMKRIDKLIESFIKNEPKIKPKKVQFFEPSKAARDSVKYDENLASEPLAKIFEKQGFFDRSIQIYEKLMLKFPEKKAYFAARIEKVQEVIKNIKK